MEDYEKNKKRVEDINSFIHKINNYKKKVTDIIIYEKLDIDEINYLNNNININLNFIKNKIVDEAMYK